MWPTPLPPGFRAGGSYRVFLPFSSLRMQPFYFEVRQTSKTGAYQHLALFAGHTPAGSPPLAHWMLPIVPPLSGSDVALLTEEPATVPLPQLLLDAGLGTLPGASLPIPLVCMQLHLVLQGQLLRGSFLLQRLQPGGATWLFSVPPTQPGRHAPLGLLTARQWDSQAGQQAA